MKFKNVLKYTKMLWASLKADIHFQIYKKDLLRDNRRNDDIYLVEFPKSGGTYLSFILNNIYILLKKNEKESITFLQNHIIDIFIGDSEGRKIVFSHTYYNPYFKAVIYLLRNPFDVMVSYYNYERDYGGPMYKSDFRKFVKSVIHEWKNHVNGWLLEPVQLGMHFLKYEDLLKNPVGEIKDIYQNFGLNVDINIIEKALELSSIKNMKESEEFFKKHNPSYKISFVGKEGKIPKEKLLTEEIKEYIIKETKDILERFYPELLI